MSQCFEIKAIYLFKHTGTLYMTTDRLIVCLFLCFSDVEWLAGVRLHEVTLLIA